MNYDVLFYRHSLFNRGGDKMVLTHAAGLVERGLKVAIAVNQVRTVFVWPVGVAKINIPWGGKLGTLAYALFVRQPGVKVIADIIPMAALLSIRNPGRVVYFCQDYDESYYSGSLSRLFVRGLYYLGLKLMRIPVIVVAAQLAGKLSRFTSRSHVVRNGVDQEFFFPDPDDQLLLSRKGQPAILVFLRADFRKGADLVCKVLQLLKSRRPDSCQVWAVGDPAVLEKAASLINESFGTVDAGLLRQLMSSSTLFLYPTRHEGLPLMVLEAMSCGCPVVASEASSEVIQDGVNGFMAPVGDVEKTFALLCSLLDSEELQDRLRRAGLETADTLSISAAQDNFFCALQEFG